METVVNRRGMLCARMTSHLLLDPAGSIPAAARHMLALQSQDLAAGRYAVAQRAGQAVTATDINGCFNRRELVRSWTMRGTLHICAAEDVRWLVRASRERTLRSMQSRLRELQITGADIDRAGILVAGLLAERQSANRARLFAMLNAHGIATNAQRGVHLLVALVMESLICLGPVPAGSGVAAQDFVLLDDWVDAHHTPEEPLRELLTRYLRGHGPTSLRDAAWYTGQTLTTLKAVVQEPGSDIAGVGHDRHGEALYTTAGSAAQMLLEERATRHLPLRLLGHFDEYYLSYADRSTVAGSRMQQAIAPGGNGMFLPFWLRGGRADEIWHADAVPAAPKAAALHHRYLGFRA
ncbi:winged helix DNA-binding domain-containing protein [Glutamicibacter sp. MNS18]|uniref:winged helix DNA-binding domain-containing protein n=1 Tax=Glutamicibacter sp. MNS18 TaxID=2989817 RepID=UPI0022355EA9|nr:winged helix DNA-binding domain-containing protein [Glutamicibacter sp. MNS18]MCW4464963.1 winged helix DNA-binding domain-containing protein [Glutamicibacter sp. MNS18]